jgi:hypothetical protein
VWCINAARFLLHMRIEVRGAVILWCLTPLPAHPQGVGTGDRCLCSWRASV